MNHWCLQYNRILLLAFGLFLQPALAQHKSDLPLVEHTRSGEATMGANARRATLNGRLLPATSFYVPNSFPNTGENRFYGFLHGISRVRTTGSRAGCEPDCSDAIAYAEMDLLKKTDYSLTLQYSLHSLSNRNNGTGFGEGQSIGFKYARKMTPSSSYSISGEHIIHLDNTVDLGRNYFIGYSKFASARPFKKFDGIGYIFNIGLGSGLYTLYENSLFSTSNFSKSSALSNEGKNIDWGVVGSASYYFSDRVSVGAEFIGYGFGIGMSVKPFRSLPITATGYLYDVLGNFPKDIPCAEDPCRPRLYARITHSF